MTVHINFNARKEEDWDKARRELGKTFKKEPYGNFIDIEESVDDVFHKLMSNEFFKRFEIQKRPTSSYKTWIQICL